MRSIFVRKLLCGKPVILIENGKILRENLRRTRVTLDELIGHLRQKDVLDPKAVQYAILETDGSLSVFPYPKERPATAKEAGIPICPIPSLKTAISPGTISGWRAKTKTGWIMYSNPTMPPGNPPFC